MDYGHGVPVLAARTLVASVFLYGLGAPLLVLVCVATALVTEHVCCKLMHRENTAGDLSCVVTAMLFAFTLPADCGYFPAILGTVFAVAVVKMLFGGIGCNFANPAVAGRVFIMLAMPIALGAYPDIIGRPLDAITGATPLAMNAAGDAPYSYMDMMFGLHAGALGETCIITLLAGYVFLLVLRVVDAGPPCRSSPRLQSLRVSPVRTRCIRCFPADWPSVPSTWPPTTPPRP